MDINLNDFDQKVIQSKLPVLVEFWASWCLPCQTADAFLKEIRKEYRGRIKVVKINVDRNPQASSQFQVIGVPTFALFSNGKEVERKVGSQTRNNLIQMINNALPNEQKKQN